MMWSAPQQGVAHNLFSGWGVPAPLAPHPSGTDSPSAGTGTPTGATGAAHATKSADHGRSPAPNSSADAEHAEPGR